MLKKVSFVLLALVVSSCATSVRSARAQQPVIALLTDFGDKDHYVGAMKGAIYTVNPSARIDSISNQVDKFAVAEGAYTLAEAAQEYPDGTVFVAIVDPGVGSSRKMIAIKTENEKIFIGPDNGLLQPAGERAGIVEIREITNRSLMHSGKISQTFHARDVFGPVAGHLAAGMAFEKVGPKVSHIVRLSESEATLHGKKITGEVLHVDGYGNLITNIPIRMVRRLGIDIGSFASLKVGKKKFKARYVRTYSDVAPGDPLFLSNRRVVEAAINQGSLAEATGAKQGVSVTIERLARPDATD